MIPAEEGHFTRGEAREGWRLSCQTPVKQDMKIELLADSGSSTKQVINATGSRKIVSVLPITEKRGDDTYICIPADAGYRISEERMER